MKVATLCIAHLILISPLVSFAQLQITELSIDANEVTLIFEDPEGTSNQFTLQSNAGLGSGSWVNAYTAQLFDLGDNRYRFVIPKPAADKEFYRIIGELLGSEVDPDGDGLPTEFEEDLGTNPTLRDSDNDGFSDGVEFAAGTDPEKMDDFPDQATLPIIGFTSDSIIISEGDSSASVTIQTGNFSGDIHYTTAAEFDPTGETVGLSTAIFGASEDHTLPASGTVTASGGKATINIPLVDDLEIDPVYRTLFIRLAAGEGYRRGGNRQVAVLIEDNDNYWHGVLAIGSSARNFRLEILNQGSNQEAWFVAGPDFDGLPKPENSNTSNASGVIPDGRFQATSVSLTSTAFTLSSPTFDLPPPESPSEDIGYNGLFGQDTLTFNRQLVLESNGSTDPYLIESNIISGIFIETLSAVGAPHLNTTDQGQFQLMKDITLPPNDVNVQNLVSAQ